MSRCGALEPPSASPAGSAPDDNPDYDCIPGAWQAHEQEPRGFLVNRLADGDAAEGLVQEVFLRAMRERLIQHCRVRFDEDGRACRHTALQGDG